MSYSWRERLQRRKKEILEALGLSQEDWDFIKENIGDFCNESDLQCKIIFGEMSDVDKEIEKMSDYEFDQMTIEVIKEIFKRLGYIPLKKRNKKKKKKQEEEEEEIIEEEKVPDDEESEEAVAQEEAIPA